MLPLEFRNTVTRLVGKNPNRITERSPQDGFPGRPVVWTLTKNSQGDYSGMSIDDTLIWFPSLPRCMEGNRKNLAR